MMKVFYWLVLSALCFACDSSSGNSPADMGAEDVSDRTDGVDISEDLATDGGAEGMAETIPEVVAPPKDIAEMTFGKFFKWTNPIEDYIAINTEELGHGNFTKDIFDLATFGDDLYFGYGDATLNLGRITPIEIRYFSDPASKDYAFEFTTDEEQIDRYRQFGDLLIIPGVDATEDGLLGNVYTYSQGGEWYKSRTLQNAWHVHDTVQLGDSLYACGSGGSLDDYAESTVHAYVWESTDGGENFEILADLEHPNPPGDQRHVYLLPNSGELYVFGYYSDDTQTTYATGYVLEEDGLVAWDGLGSFFVLDTVILDGDNALVVGVHIEQPLRQGAMLVENGVGSEVLALQDFTVLDVEPLGDGRGLVLYLDGNAYPLADTGGWPAHVGVLNPSGSLVEIGDLFPTVRPASIAYWHGRLYVGMADGNIWRAGVVE
jgi:hypothetical protein